MVVWSGQRGHAGGRSPKSGSFSPTSREGIAGWSPRGHPPFGRRERRFHPDVTRFAPLRGRPSMDTKNVEQNLLFALVALKMGWIDDEALIVALNEWSLRKDRSVDRVLVEHKAITEARLSVVAETFTSLL